MQETNPVIDCLMNHRSIRKFKPAAIPEATIDTILRAGTRAATAGCMQPYAFIVLDDPKVLEQVGYITGPLAVVAVVDLYRIKRYYELNDAPFYNDQAVNLLISFWDATIALHNVVIAAESLGLGGYYIGMILSQDLRESLSVPDYVVPAGLVALGYPDEAPNLAPRLPLEAVVHRNRYHIPSDDDIREWYRVHDEPWMNRFESEWSE
ncbi:MAG: nitroreductase family protein, partial [Candidatus Bipolaricaulis sp.]|nr:nitroreductase family protein [Candidatus Bipolaricaulis sp.]